MNWVNGNGEVVASPAQGAPSALVTIPELTRDQQALIRETLLSIQDSVDNPLKRITVKAKIFLNFSAFSSIPVMAALRFICTDSQSKTIIQDVQKHHPNAFQSYVSEITEAGKTACCMAILENTSALSEQTQSLMDAIFANDWQSCISTLLHRVQWRS